LVVLKNEAAAATLAQLMGGDRVSLEEAHPGNYAMLSEIDFRNALFAPFADPRFSDFTKIHFWKYRRLDPATIANARVLAKFDSGDAALVEVPLAKGRLLVLTSAWHPEDSQLALSTNFVPLVYSILETSGAPLAVPSLYHIGDTAPAPLESGLSPSHFEIITPEGVQLSLGESETNFSRTLSPGIYTWKSTSPPKR